MICSACSIWNDPQNASCGACGGTLHVFPTRQIRQVATIAHPVEARIAEAELRLATLTRHIAAAEAERAAIADSLALARASVDAAHAANGSKPAAIAQRSLDAGRFRVTFGGSHGTTLDLAGVRYETASASAAPLTVAAAHPSHLIAQADALSAVWQAFAGGARIVRVAGEPGAGATALLQSLASCAPLHGFANGALYLRDTRGPAADVAQRVAALHRTSEPVRYYLAPELPRLFSDSSLLILLDRAELSVQEQAELADFFPGLRFVLVHSAAHITAATIELGPLDAQTILSIAGAAYGRVIDPADHEAALAVCATAGGLPGPARLIGHAARELRRSFTSLRAEFATGGAIIRALIAALSPEEQRTLSIVRLAPGVLSATQIGAILGQQDARTILEHLCKCEVVQRNGEAYVLPGCIGQLVPALPDADVVREHVIDAVCAALDQTPASAFSQAKLIAAEPILQAAFERSQWPSVLALGVPLAQALAQRGAFGAWGRVLNLVAAAAKRVDDPSTLGLAKHELGVRSLLLGESHKATTYLHSAALAREKTGDEAGAAASEHVLALVEDASPATDVDVEQTVPREPRVRARRNNANRRPPFETAVSGMRPDLVRHLGPFTQRSSQRWWLFGVTLAIVVFFGVWAGTRPQNPPAIREFRAERDSIAAGSTAQLCIAATDAAVLTVTPDVGPLPVGVRQCVTVRPTRTTTYTALAIGSQNQEERETATVRVGASAGPSALTIEALFFSPTRITAGRAARLCYAVTGAEVVTLRTIPSVGSLKRLQACRRVWPTQSGRTTYKLLAIGGSGQVVMRRAQVEVVAPAATPSPLPSPPPPMASASRPARPRAAPRSAVRNVPDGDLARRAVYQFDVTPSIVERGQAASLCVGIGHWARGSVTQIGRLVPGITRCYRVHPSASTAYHLHVALDDSNAVETLNLAVRTPVHAHQIAHDEHR